MAPLLVVVVPVTVPCRLTLKHVVTQLRKGCLCLSSSLTDLLRSITSVRPSLRRDIFIYLSIFSFSLPATVGCRTKSRSQTLSIAFHVSYIDTPQ